MNLVAFIHASNPTKVSVVERERDVDEPQLLDTIVGRTVPLLPVASDRADSELEASVERLFDEGGSAPVQLIRQGKRKSVAVDAGGASHPPKNPKEDHRTVSGTSLGGKSQSTLQRLLVEAVLNVEVGVAAIPTLPLATASVSTTPERKDRGHTGSMTESNIHTIRALRRFFVSSDSSHHSGTNVMEAKVASAPSSTLMLIFKKFTSLNEVTNGSRLDDGRVCHENVDEFSLSKFSVSVRGMKHDQLFTEFNVGAVRPMSLSAEVRMRAEYNIKENRRLKSVVDEQAELLKVREKEIKNLKVQLSPLRDETNALKERNAILENERDALDVKVTELETSAASKDRELTDLNALVTSVKSQNDNLVDREKVTVYKNYMEQLEKF
nr:hypothetical protein [Tanacetum cinerariifolium]